LGTFCGALPTVRKIALDNGGKVDFACMPQYRSLIPLIAGQSYIDKAFVIEDWQCTGSPYGDQPWQSPKQEGYDKQIDLTYRAHPYGEFLADNIARRQGVELKDVIPFIDAPKMEFVDTNSCVPVQWNARRRKIRFPG
jgi:hypothetical protein